jgi:hypothetical protein
VAARELPLGKKAYGRIPHLPGSRTGPADRTCTPEVARWCLTKPRKNEQVVVQEKLDGTCVAVANVGGEIVPLGREGKRAAASPNEGRQRFARWALERAALFGELLREGEWLVGEWLALAHGTRYALEHEPFVPFDLFMKGERVPYDVLSERVSRELRPAALLHRGAALPIAHALELLGERGRHGALDAAEGVVYRLEREGRVTGLAKFVRPGKVDGSLLPENTGKPPVWNVR